MVGRCVEFGTSDLHEWVNGSGCVSGHGLGDELEESCCNVDRMGWF